VAIYYLKWIKFISFEKQNAEGTDVNPPQKPKNWPRKENSRNSMSAFQEEKQLTCKQIIGQEIQRLACGTHKSNLIHSQFQSKEEAASKFPLWSHHKIKHA